MNASTAPSADDRTRELLDALARVGTEYREHPDVRAQLDADPRAYFAARGVEFPERAELRVAANTPETFHLVMPANPNDVLADTKLSGVAGGVRLASQACAVGCIIGSLASSSTLRA